jgi:two-component sensor histidine kinase
VHEQCYRSSDFRCVDILTFIRALGVQLKCTFPLENVEFTVKGARLYLDMQKAIPFGIIANEILSNAFRHAFGEEAGRVSVEVEPQGEGEWKITFGDSGKGIPPHVDLETPETLGLRLIRDLADQIDGKLTIERGRGTVYTLRVPC